MKKKINIFYNNNINDFIRTFLFEYELTFLKLEDINYKEQSDNLNIIIISNENDTNKINFENINDNNLKISNLINKKLNFINKQQLLNIPTTINNIKSKIESFSQNLKVSFHDISIDNEKLTNLKNNSFCYLTKVELEILTCLIREKETSKNFIKENILKIKSNIETNSLESHLTRIRKKMNKVKTNVKIQTKSEKLKIVV